MKGSASTLLIGCLLAVSGAALAADDAPTRSVEERLNVLESRWARMEADMTQIRQLLEAQSKTPAPAATTAIAAVVDNVQGLRQDLSGMQEEVARQRQVIAAESQARQRAIAISTYGQINALKSSGQDSLIDAESFELVFSGQPHPQISFFSELEFERAATVGADRGGEVLVEQAYVDYAITDAMSLRAGVVLVPFGNNEADHYAPLRDVIARPLSSRLIAPSDWTDNAFGLVGHRELAEFWQLDWEAYLMTGLGDDVAGYGLRNARQGFGVDNNNDKAFAGHLALRRGDALSMGLGLYDGAYDDDGQHDLQGIGVDFVWYPAPWKVSGEYVLMQGERASSDDALLRGGYLRIGYDIDTWLPPAWAGEAFPDARLALVYEYDMIRLQDLADALSPSAREHKHVLGLRFQPDHSWILKLNREWSDADGPLLVNGDFEEWMLGIGFVF